LTIYQLFHKGLIINNDNDYENINTIKNIIVYFIFLF
jgi:hypothetical protein